MCKLGVILTERLNTIDRALLRAWIDTGHDGQGRSVSAAVMAAALTADGHKVGPTTLKDHRGRRCACWRAAQ